MAGLERHPLSPSQRQTAGRLSWYRAWLLSTGRTDAEVGPEGVAGPWDGGNQQHPPTTDQHVLPAEAAAADDVQER
jgi:hypothetical protein